MRENRNAPAGNRGASKVRFVEETATSILPAFGAPDPIYETRLTGWLEGYHSRDAEIAKLNHEADRLYVEMCRRPAVPFIDPNRKSYQELQAIRAEIYGGAA